MVDDEDFDNGVRDDDGDVDGAGDLRGDGTTEVKRLNPKCPARLPVYLFLTGTESTLRRTPTLIYQDRQRCDLP